jgi:hypothetical protein
MTQKLTGPVAAEVRDVELEMSSDGIKKNSKSCKFEMGPSGTWACCAFNV